MQPIAWLNETLELGALPWQKRFTRGALSHDESVLTVARGAGKTALVASLAAWHLWESVQSGEEAEVLFLAGSHSQARIAFSDGLRVLRSKGLKSGREWSIQDSGAMARVSHRLSDSAFRCAGANARALHGARPSWVVMDEPAQWPPGLAESMTAAARTGLGKRSESRLIIIGTRPASGAHWFAKLLDSPPPGSYVQAHAARVGDPPFQQRTWQRANPSLRYMPSLQAAYRKDAARARKLPSELAAFKSLRLNLGTSDTTEQFLISPELWEKVEVDGRHASGPCVWGLDLGTSAAISAVAAYWPETGALAVLGAFPTIPALSERGVADGVGSLYQEMAQRGELITCGGMATDVGQLLTEALARFGPPSCVVSDRWRLPELVDSLRATSVPACVTVTRGQGFRDGGEDVEAFRRAVLEGRVTPERSLLIRSCMSEARTVTDTAGNSKLAKATEGQRRGSARDDAAAASILAVAEGSRFLRAQTDGEPMQVLVV